MTCFVWVCHLVSMCICSIYRIYSWTNNLANVSTKKFICSPTTGRQRFTRIKESNLFYMTFDVYWCFVPICQISKSVERSVRFRYFSMCNKYANSWFTHKLKMIISTINSGSKWILFYMCLMKRTSFVSVRWIFIGLACLFILSSSYDLKLAIEIHTFSCSRLFLFDLLSVFIKCTQFYVRTYHA